MPVLSYVHQLFTADQCQADIHTLRWKDRPLQCPRCQSHNVGPWGAYHYQPGLQRYRCKEKEPTFKGSECPYRFCVLMVPHTMSG
jgi:transposase-like protein